MILKKYLSISITIIGLLLITLQLSAQNTVVRGKVTEQGTGKPLPGVTVAEKDKENRQVNGVMTDINGNYQLKIADSRDSLSFSQIGMISVVKLIGNQQVINVVMVDDVKSLTEVQVNATAQKRSEGFLGISDRDRTDAHTRINMKDLEDIPATSIDQVLQGKAAGLLISMNSGNPGSGSSIQIRGATSIGLGTKPLIVVDDVPFKSQATVDVSNSDAISELINISPTDIASIDILKDAAATAVYGSDGANGVILIKTKRGDNQKPRISITSTSSVKVPQTQLPLLNGDQYKTMILEAYQNRFGTTGIDLTTSPIANLFLQPGALNYENYNNNTNWQQVTNMPFALTQDYNSSIIGGGESAKYLVSLGYTDEVGPLKGTSYKRLSTRFNFDYKLSDNLSFTSDIAYTNGKKNRYYESDGNNTLKKAPIFPIYTQDQYGNDLSTYFVPGTGGFQNDLRNPIALIDNAMNIQGNQRLDAKLTIRYRPFKNFQFNNLFSVTNESYTSDAFLPQSASGLDYYRQNNLYLRIDQNTNLASSNPGKSSSLYFKNDIIYKFTLPAKFGLNAGLFTVFQSIPSNNIPSSAIKLISSNTPSNYLSSPYTSDIFTEISSATSLQRSLSVIAQANFTYDERYSVTGSLDREGNSAFGENNRYAIFPAISVGWHLASEHFIKDRNWTWLDDIKFRGSWGISGRAPNVSNANAFTFSANAPFVDIQGVNADNIQLVNLRWEKTTTSDAGLEISLWKGRLNIVTDYSVATTRDLILSSPIATSSGFENISTNFGTIQGKTFEFTVAGDAMRSKDWILGGSFNISTSSTAILSLPNNNAPVVRANVLDNGTYMTLINVGDPIGTFYGLQYLGVYKTDADAFAKDNKGNFITDFNGNRIPMRWNDQSGEIFTGGDAHYADLNNDGVINKQDVKALGNTNPQFYGGLILRASYKATWQLLAVFNYQTNFDIINMAQANTTNMYSNNNQSTAVLRRWRKQGDDTDVPRALYGGGHNWVGSDRYIENGSFIRLNSVSLTYNLAKSLLSRLNIRSAKATFSVSNAKTFTRYTGADPSTGANRNDPFNSGVDKALTPIAITYSLGLNVNF
jgi:TonB-linked SusC/RagA family outer membrane protein